MSSRPLIIPNPNNPLINAVSMASTITGPVTIIQTLPGISYDLVWTGTPNGVFTVQVSNSYSQNAAGVVVNTGSWTVLPSSSFTGTFPVPSGSAGNGFIDVVGTEAYAIQLVYTPSSGSGNLTVLVNAKVL